MDSAQRQIAINNDKAFIKANPNKDTKSYDPTGNKKPGYKGTKPGEATDCSGLASDSRVEAGEPNPVGTAEAQKKAMREFGKENGVAQLAVSTVSRTTDVNKAEIGDEIYFNNYSHVGHLTEKISDKNGNVTHISFSHSSKSYGPHSSSIPINGTKY